VAGASHRIGVLEIELRLEEEPQAHPLMDRVSALRAPRLEAVMQRVLDELSPAGQLDRFERVELDLGPLPLNDFDDAFLARLEPALRQALALQLQEQPATAPITPVLELLRLFARTGSLPWWAARSDPQLINAQIRRALELDPGAWWALVRELQAHPAALERLAAALPAEAPLGIEAEGPPPSPALPRAEALQLLPEPGHRLALRRPGASHTAPRPAADPADPDELAIDDGGLVILWPLMDTLLSRLEYVDPQLKRFASEAARNQAIALLSFLVEGEADPPEWRLALAKVLCGLSPLAPWRLNDPLMPEVLAEGERLLQAVIAHGDLAAELDVEDLRQLILRRPAVLTSRTGAWLLQVERRPEDRLLERFPWGWRWIRLPWMDHPLQVEW